MKSYIINLERSKDRWGFMEKQFVEKGLAFERVDAIDGSKFDEEFLKDNLQPMSKTKCVEIHCLTPSELACNLSHAKALDLIANGEDEYGAVFEDDIYLSPKAVFFLKSYDWIPKGTTMIKLDKGWHLYIKNILRIPFSLPEGRLLCKFILNPFGAGSYIVSKETAAWLSKELRKTKYLVDVFYFDSYYGICSKLKPLQLSPAISEAPYQSTNEAIKLFKVDIEHAEQKYGRKCNRIPFYIYMFIRKMQLIKGKIYSYLHKAFNYMSIDFV